MTPRQSFDYAIDHELIELMIEPDTDDNDELHGIDLSKGVDESGYTVDGCISADLVRRYQDGELAGYLATPRTTEAADELQGCDGLQLVGQAYTGVCADWGHPDDDVLDAMADDNADALATLVAAHKRTAR